jgi:NAD/NADP transhydrogenase beta subunit
VPRDESFDLERLVWGVRQRRNCIVARATAHARLEDIAVQMAYASKVIFVPGYVWRQPGATRRVNWRTFWKSRGHRKYGFIPLTHAWPHERVGGSERSYSQLYELSRSILNFTTDVAVVIGANMSSIPTRDNRVRLPARRPRS